MPEARRCLKPDDACRKKRLRLYTKADEIKTAAGMALTQERALLLNQ